MDIICVKLLGELSVLIMFEVGGLVQELVLGRGIFAGC